MPADEEQVAATVILDAGTTGVGDEMETGRVLLLRNIPNPFSRTTSIHYTLPRTAVVHLAMYSITGRLVRLIENGVRTGGPHDVRWDGIDGDGRRVSPGAYTYRLTVDGQEQSHLLTLVR